MPLKSKGNLEIAPVDLLSSTVRIKDEVAKERDGFEKEADAFRACAARLQRRLDLSALAGSGGGVCKKP